ncbi:MAG: glycosyltransferase family 1 protein [Capsulimonadales bacterium]|nr:glycosyltransferase family 1 protein [Capsulimonadales bacterium]
MKVGISTFGGDGGKSGISQYVIFLLREFARMQSNDPKGPRFEVIVHEDEKDVFAPAALGLETLCLPASLRPALKNILWHQTELPRLCRERGYDVLFLPAGNRRLPFRCPCPTVGMVHDFSILHVPGKYDRLHHLYITKGLPFLARRLTRVLAPSESSRQDILSFARIPAERVQVIPEAADTAFYRAIPRPEAEAYVAERYPALAGRPFLLYVSRIEHPGKNHVRLIRAFARLKRECRVPHVLLLAGSEWSGAEAVHAEADASGVGSEILFTGFVPRADIPYLYSATDLFVFPSLWEGFGLPVLEAMSCGAPVACSGVSSLPEVAGDAAILFDPTDEQDIARKLGDILSDPRRRAELARRGQDRSRSFSWERAAQETMEAMRTACQPTLRKATTREVVS